MPQVGAGEKKYEEEEVLETSCLKNWKVTSLCTVVTGANANNTCDMVVLSVARLGSKRLGGGPIGERESPREN